MPKPRTQVSNRNPRTFEDFAATNRQFVAELITGGVILVCKILLAPILRRLDFGSDEFGSNGLNSILYQLHIKVLQSNVVQPQTECYTLMWLKLKPNVAL